MQQRSGRHYIQAKKLFIDSGRIGKVTLARTWWHGNGYHLRKAPASLQSLPSNLDWARYLGPLKWRDYDPQQYYNFRAYLDYGGGQVTDLFTHWVDVVHMLLGRDNPTSGVAAGGVYHYKDGRTAPDTINVLLEYGGDFTDKAVAVAPGTLQTAWRIGKGFLNDAEVAEWDKLGKPEVDAVAEAQGESEAAPEAQVADATSAGERAVAEAEPDAPVPDTVAAASDAEAAPEPEVAAEAGPEAGNTEPEQKKAKA